MRKKTVKGGTRRGGGRSLERMWAPWRHAYLCDAAAGKRCIFCIPKKSSRRADAGRYIIERSGQCFSILNRFPYNNGHVMIAPYRHVSSLEMLDDEAIADMMKLLNRTKVSLDRLLKPHGYNIGMNIGRTAGAGFAGHVHMHIVPRWNGDTNFMPCLAGVKVISESLDHLFKDLKRAPC